jgi:serine/threonine protein kinase
LSIGEVYRATDTTLKRAVAIKVVSAALALDQERIARLQREAQVLASLNHPNIRPAGGAEDEIVELPAGEMSVDLPRVSDWSNDGASLVPGEHRKRPGARRVHRGVSVGGPACRGVEQRQPRSVER